MLDIQFIRENADLVQEKSGQKNVDVNIHELLDLDTKRRDLQTRVEDLREQRNKLSSNITAKPSPEDIERGAHLKSEIAQLESEYGPVESSYLALLKKVPNMPTDDVPVGKTEEENKVTKVWGEIKDYGFQPKTHWELGESRDLIDRDRASRISGSRFAYLKGGLVQLQFALLNFTMSLLTDERIIERLIKENNLELSTKPFTPILPPVMMRTDAYEATGRLKAEEVTYKLADDDLWLIASAEHSLVSMYMNEILDETLLPIRYLGYSTSFRREAGSYGRDTNGIVRMHHFDKIEMEVFSTPETSRDEHLLLVAIQEHLTQELNLPYRVLLKCTADIGDANARGVDIEMWMPGQNKYIETHSADYMTDYQSRDLKTRVRRQNGTIDLVHNNDATAFAMGRTLAAIIENYQTDDGRIIVPERLRPFLGKEEI
jgi:seryl-tRNA synthetase